MNRTWIVAANAGRARFFSQQNAAAGLEEVSDMANTAARLDMRDLASDEMGQRAASKSRHGVGQPTQPSGYQPHQTPAQHQTELFARDVAGFLREAQKDGKFADLFLVASPEFLGELRRQLDEHLQSAVRLQIDKDYTHFNGAELKSRIEAHRARH